MSFHANFGLPLSVAFDQAVFEEIKRISMGEWMRNAVDAEFERHQQQIKEEVS